MISVVIPAHDEEHYIEKTLRAVPKTDTEIIVVCNGCTDNTANIAQKYAVTYVLEEKNASLARNYGARKANGDIILFLDADTLLTAEALAHIRRIPEKSFFGTCRVNPDGGGFLCHMHTSIKNILGIFGFHNASGMIFCTKDVFQKVQFNERMPTHENMDFTKRAKPYAKRYFLPCYITTSMRRFEKLGYLKVVLYWLKETFVPTRKYPTVR